VLLDELRLRQQHHAAHVKQARFDLACHVAQHPMPLAVLQQVRLRVFEFELVVLGDLPGSVPVVQVFCTLSGQFILTFARHIWSFSAKVALYCTTQ